ncbi:MAG TPA: VOC family protein [Thermoanaerobaculia bacterium]|nr:VOC family protein [Thermoanaerobaculia bacterium]
MAEVFSHDPGRFCWFELATPDPEVAKDFYRGLFGWTAVDTPAGSGRTYTLLKLHGQDVAALYELDSAQSAQGVPTHWLSYVAVAEVAPVVNRCRELGGVVLVDPLPVKDLGCLAILADPEGAPFALWQARSHIGASRLNEPGAVCWNELATYDAPDARRFYQGLFGWQADVKNLGQGEYTEWSHGAYPAAGMYQLDEETAEEPPHWTVYFSVGSCDQAAARADQLGGRVISPPANIPGVGRFAALQDPLGASFSVIQLETLN